MDRIRDGRRGGVSVGGGPPPPRRRLRSNGGGGGGVGPRDSPRSERRRGERLMLNGGGGGAGRDDGDDTSDESLADDDDDAEEELAPRYQQQRRSPSTAPPPPSPPQPGGGHHHSSSSSGGGGGGYHNHHHGQQHQMQRKGGGSNPKSPIVAKAVDEMIGVPVPRKARSASTKRSSHEWPVPGGGTSGGSAGVGDGSQIQRPSSRPISPASASTTAPARKKLKPLGGGSSGGPGPAPKQRPSPSPAPSTTPPQPQPPKISKSPSFIQEEIEVAEVLFGLTRQFPCPPKQESNHKVEPRDAPEAKSGNSSPAPSSSGARPADSTSLSTIAPKRKRPRLVKYDEDSRLASPAKPEVAEPSSKPEPPPLARSEAKTATSAAAESGTSTAPAAVAQLETSREPEKTEDRGRSRDSELRPSESDRRDHRLESQAEPPAPLPAPSVKPDAEAKPVGSEARNGEATATTKIELASDGARQDKKFSIDLMAPPPGKLSDDIDGSSDPDADKKGLDSEMDMLGRGNSEKKDGEKTRRGLDIDLEDQKVQRIPADEFTPKKLTLQLDLEKPSLGDEKSPSERRQPQPQPQQLQQQKPSKAEIKHEKSAMPAATPPMPIPVGGWLGNFPPFGYLSPVPGLSAAGLHHPMDVKPGSSSGLQHAALLPPPTRSKRCATHCYIAQFIQHQQRVAKMNSFWPPAAAAAAAAAANRSGPFFGARPFSMGVVPPTDAASMLVNPMQGGYPVRAHTPMQEAKAPSLATSPFQGSLSKDKALGNAAGAESNQRKQPPAHETQQSTPIPNMLQAPAFIFPFNQQHAMVAAANAANRAGDAKSSGASNAMPPSASAHTSAANSGAAAMNLSFANLQPADAQFLAILQNGYPFQVAAHPGGPPYRGMAPPGPAVPFFNGVYSSPMLHPSQQQGAQQQQSHQKTQMSNLPSSSQKHQPQQSQGLLGYAPNANAAAAAAASNSQNYSSGNQRPVLLSGLTHRQESDKPGQDGPSSDDKPSHSQKSGYEHNFAVPVHLPNFAMMPAAQAAGSQSEKKLSDHHHQQQPQVSRGQGVRIDLGSSQPFVMPFGSIGPPGSAPTGLDFSALAQNHAVFQSHQEAARHGYPQLNFAAAQSMQSTQHKPQHGETKSLAGDSSSTPIAGDSERKKSTSTKYPGDSQQHSLSFARTESKNYVPPFLSGSTNESSSHTLSLIGTESSNTFMGSKPTNSTTPASTPASATSTISQQQQHQHFLQMQVQQKHQQHQQLIQHHHLNRPRSAAPSTQNSAGRYPDGLNMASFQNMMYSSSAAQGGVQSPQLKASSGRGTPSSTATTPPAAPPNNLIVMKNSGLHQQQAKGPMQAISTPGHQPQSSLSMSSSKMGPSVTNLSTGGGDLSRSSNAPVASGSPSNSVSKSTGGSPPATGNAKGVQQPVQLPSPQQQSAKNSASTSGSKSTPTNHFSMAMPSILGQQPNASPGSNPGSKQQSHMPPSSMKQQPFPQGHFFISNTYAPQAPGAGGATALGLYQKRPGDKTQQQATHQQNALSAAAGNNMKALHPSSAGFMHLAAATQSAGGVPHTHMSAAQLTFGAMPMPLKPSSDQKPAAGK